MIQNNSGHKRKLTPEILTATHIWCDPTLLCCLHQVSKLMISISEALSPWIFYQSCHSLHFQYLPRFPIAPHTISSISFSPFSSPSFSFSPPPPPPLFLSHLPNHFFILIFKKKNSFLFFFWVYNFLLVIGLFATLSPCGSLLNLERVRVCLCVCNFQF